MATATTPTPAPVTLALRGSSYTFHPQPERGVVEVAQRGPWVTRKTTLPVGEAKKWWRVLVRRGYTRF